MSEKYGIGRSTISDIKHKEVELKEYYRSMKEMGMAREVKIMKCGKDMELEKALFIWFKQKRRMEFPLAALF